ncbi:MAG: endonuclease/exonuclease/phosphatase family protein [Ktedonobacteraceae bacterium]|nr:endonuclease/exonuclease/phosphatase family protein [Ktedonobacteraceae bacterium]
MTRIVSYNILAGGYSLRNHGTRRTNQLVHIIRSAQPDIVGVAEAINRRAKASPEVIDEIAEQLGMQLVRGNDPNGAREFQTALLTRLPIVYTKTHVRPGILARPLLEVCVEEENGQHLTVFVVHLSAAFNRGRGGGGVRMREMREILNIMAPLRAEGKPHLLMGDFNSMAPGEPFRASALLKYIVLLDARRRSQPNQHDGHPHLNSVVPRKLRFLKPALRVVAESSFLSMLFDTAAYFYAPRGCIRLLKEYYVDSFRHINVDEDGFTCPAAAPAGRIDYIFSSPVLAERLEECHVIVEGDGLAGSDASDHLAVAAAFRPVASLVPPATELDDAITH